MGEHDGATREAYIAIVGDRDRAIRFEQDALSIGREFLPEHARAVLEGIEPTAAYWAWLKDQFVAADGIPF
jgi:hypothetical protein